VTLRATCPGFPSVPIPPKHSDLALDVLSDLTGWDRLRVVYSIEYKRLPVPLDYWEDFKVGFSHRVECRRSDRRSNLENQRSRQTTLFPHHAEIPGAGQA